MSTILSSGIARLLLPVTFIAAIALLVKGYHSVGDGFSAGVTAASGILLQYLAFRPGEVEQLTPVRHSLAIAMLGLLLAFSVVFLPVFFGLPVLTHFPRPEETVTKLGTLELHTAVLFDLGVFGLVFGFIVTTMRALMRVEQERPT
ncbi:MAG: MnhB domain-containing protein [Chloroflexota bacterium]|nr:MnhB domain-containing protein [Chloroflexota bacterium]